MALAAEDIRRLLPGLLRQAGELSVQGCRRLTAGASAVTWLIDAQLDGQPRQLVLRLDAGGESFGITPGKAVEAAVQQAAHDAGAPTPPVLAAFESHEELGSGYLMEALSGESLPQRLLREERFDGARALLPEQLGQALARIHAVTPDALPSALPRLDAATQLEQLYRLHRDYGEFLPVFSLAYGWLRDRVPPNTASRLVHGDFRMGNFMVDENGLRGVLDWEMTHLGDPLEDLGWLCVNAWRFGRSSSPVAGLGDRAGFYRAYEAAGGCPVEPRHARYWELFGTFKWGVICQYQAYLHLRGQVSSMERAAIGRRVAETEYDMLVCLEEIMELEDAA